MKSVFIAAVLAISGLLAFDAAAAEPYGKIGEKYAALGGRGGPLGPPIGAESDAPHGGRLHYFKNGSIYWHPRIGTAYATWGLISVKFHQMGRVEYGYPITDELKTPDGRGRFNHFRAIHLPGAPEASIYWTPETGAHAVYGMIRTTWARGGWERGELGYPTSDEFQDGRFRRSNFERGYIIWAADTGAKVVKSGAAVLATTPPNTFGTILVTGMEVALKGNRVAGDSQFLSENAVCALWSRELPRINEELKQRIRAMANPRMRGFTIRSDAQMLMSSACSFRAEVVGACSDKVTVRMLLPRNLLKFHVTTPSVFGGWADPEFSVDFDLAATATIQLPRNGASPIGLGRTQLRVSNVRLDSQNVTGDALLAVKEVYQTISGVDLTAPLTQDRAFSFEGVTRTLADLNPALGRIPSNFHVDSCIAASNTLRLNGTDVAYQGPIVR